MRDIRNDNLIIREMKYRKENTTLRTHVVNAYFLEYNEVNNEIIAVRHFDGSLMLKEDVKTVIDGLSNFLENKYSDEQLESYNLSKSAEYKHLIESPIRSVSRSTRSNLSKASIEQGYIYFIKEEFSGTIKIGKTNNVPERSRLFNVKLPFEWNFIKIIKSKDYSLTELLLHQKFNDKRINGEWFSLSERDIAEITEENFGNDILQSIRGEGEIYES